MISSKDLTEEQKSAIVQWAGEGSQLADIQKRLKGQFGLNLTYMDTRFLILDLGIELEAEEGDTNEVRSPLEASNAGSAPDSPLPAAAGVSVTTDELARPGALVSGRVTFSDGEKGIWLIDQMGQLAFDSDTPGYEPSEADARTFESELRRALGR